MIRFSLCCLGSAMLASPLLLAAAVAAESEVAAPEQRYPTNSEKLDRDKVRDDLPRLASLRHNRLTTPPAPTATVPPEAVAVLTSNRVDPIAHPAIAAEPFTLEPPSEQAEIPVTIGQSLPGNSETTGWYLSISPSVVFGYDLSVESDDPATVTLPAPLPGLPPVINTVPVDIDVDTDTGFGIGGAVGYRFNDARVEFEVDYNRNGVSSITVNDVEGTGVDGSLETLKFFVNGYYDIPTGSRFRPYVGGGVGLAIFSANDVEAAVPVLGGVSVDDSSTGFAFQAKAGVNYDISETAIAFLGYRLYGLPGQSFEAFDTDLDADSVFVHSLQLGLRYEF